MLAKLIHQRNKTKSAFHCSGARHAQYPSHLVQSGAFHQIVVISIREQIKIFTALSTLGNVIPKIMYLSRQNCKNSCNEKIQHFSLGPQIREILIVKVEDLQNGKVFMDGDPTSGPNSESFLPSILFETPTQ